MILDYDTASSRIVENAQRVESDKLFAGSRRTVFPSPPPPHHSTQSIYCNTTNRVNINLRFFTAACYRNSPTPEQARSYQEDSPLGIARRGRQTRPARDPPNEVRQKKRTKKQPVPCPRFLEGINRPTFSPTVGNMNWIKQDRRELSTRMCFLAVIDGVKGPENIDVLTLTPKI